jgi:Tol biopolymer transport system component
MGEVYRAKDIRLNRTVAIKVLPAQVTDRSDLRQRLEREARAVSSLNHPHICTLHDIGHQDGIDYLVMEYLEGETLAQRLSKGAMPLDQVLRYAIEIADALDQAHRHGITHRDLKPGNVMLTRSGAKLLDFGLAKHKVEAASSRLGPSAETALLLRTEAHALTEKGTLLGTLQYMAPEQLEGKDADARTDLFAFGAVLYEMATGQKAFTGKSQASLIAAILEHEPSEMSSLQPMTPPTLGRVVKTCLAKDPDERWQSAHDVLLELKWLTEGGLQPGVATLVVARLKRRERLAWIAAGVFFLASLLLLPFSIAHFRQAPVETRPMKFSILPPEKASLGSLAVSPDGRWLAFSAATRGKDQLWVEALGTLSAQALAGTEGARYPFWSPDSRLIGFFAGGKLKKIGVTGGPAQSLCDAGTGGMGGAWNRDGMIVFAMVGFGLYRVSAMGGDLTLIMAIDKLRQDMYHSPSFLPDARHFLYYVMGGRKESRGVYLGSLDGGVNQRVLGAESNAVYASPGYLLFLREGALVAQPFDPQQLKLTGELFPNAEWVGRDPNFNRGNFSVSDNGVLVHDSSVNRESKQLVWVDREGKQIRSLGEVGAWSGIRLSPDEKRFVVDRFDIQADTNDLWLCDVVGAGASRFTFDPANDRFPVWSPDGSRIVWSSSRKGMYDLYQKAASGAGQDEPLLKSSNSKFLTDWSRDGRFLIYYQIDPKTKRDLWVLPLAGEQKPFPFLQTEANEVGGELSPDGRWMAYASDQSGRYEVYVQSFPAADGQKQVSIIGGIGPHWRRDGKELFYYAPDGKLMAVEVNGGVPGQPADTHGGRQGVSFEAGQHRTLFEFRSGNAIVNAAPYAITADGQRFLLNTLLDESGGAPLTVVVNWAAELRR